MLLRKYAQRLLAPDGAGGGSPAAPATPPPPTPPPPTPPPPTPPPPTPPPVEPTPTPPPEPQPPVKDDPLLAALFRDMDEPPQIKPVTEAPPNEPTTPSAEPAAAAPQAATTHAPTTPPAEPASEKGKRRKKYQLVSELDKPPAPAPAQTPQPAPAPAEPLPADPDDGYIAGLTDDQREELSEAEVAERMYPEKYKGRKKALVDWYRKLDDASTKMLAENPERKFDDEDEDFQKFLKTKPRMEASHAKTVQRQIGADVAARTARAEYEPRLNELARKQEEQDYRPKVASVVKEVETGMEEIAVQDEKSGVGAAIKALRAAEAEESQASAEQKPAAKERREQLAKAYALEKRVFDDEKSLAAKLTETYLMFAKKLVKFDPQNADHNHLLRFVEQQGQLMSKQGDDVTVVNGKRFLSRSDYVRLKSENPQEAEKHWTFTHRDIIEMLAVDAVDRAGRRVLAEEARLVELGFARPKPAVSAQPPKAAAAQPQPLEPPKAQPTPVRGTASTTVGRPTQPGGAVGDPIDVLGTLRLRENL